jgi:hypothetical protein
LKLAGHGLISLIVHPDYIISKKSNNTYRRLLAHLAHLREKMFVWAALPREINKWWRLRLELKLVADGLGWRIEGDGQDRARVAYAHLADGRVKYSFEASLMPRPQAETNARDAHSKGISGLQRSPDSVTTN